MEKKHQSTSNHSKKRPKKFQHFFIIIIIEIKPFNHEYLEEIQFSLYVYIFYLKNWAFRYCEIFRNYKQKYK